MESMNYIISCVICYKHGDCITMVCMKNWECDSWKLSNSAKRFDTSSRIFPHMDKWCGLTGFKQISFAVEIQVIWLCKRTEVLWSKEKTKPVIVHRLEVKCCRLEDGWLAVLRAETWSVNRVESRTFLSWQTLNINLNPVICHFVVH